MAIRTASSRSSRTTSTRSGSVSVIGDPTTDSTNDYVLAGTGIATDTVFTELLPAANTATSITSVVATGTPTISNVVFTNSSYTILAGNTAANLSGAYASIFGTSFQSNSNVFINGSLVSNTRVGTTRINLALSNVSVTGTYNLMVFNGDRLAARSTIFYYPAPVWTSSSFSSLFSSGSFQLAATNTTSYAVTGGTLPGGLTFYSNGLMSATGTTSGSFTVTATGPYGQATAQTVTLTIGGNYTINYLVVAGGGGGGGSGGGTGGGGGAGGLLSGTTTATPLTPYTVQVGAGGGGSPGSANQLGSPGFSSNISAPGFTTVSAAGGGAAGGATAPGLTIDASPGGSGGGATGNTGGNGQQAVGGAGVNFPGPAQQGYPGGSTWQNTYAGAGGGGAGGAGVSLAPALVGSAVGGNGGPGYTWPITGNTYAGGGGGGSSSGPTGGTGGPGGGGNGYRYGGPNIGPGIAAADGTINKGGGGGGGFVSPSIGGAGGSGVVIIAYSSAPGAQIGSGGTVTTTGTGPGLYYLHTYTTSSTFTSTTVPTWVTSGALSSINLLSPITTTTLSATDVSTVSFNLASGNTLPTGVTLSSGVLSGTPTTGGSYSFYIIATNVIGAYTNQLFTLTVNRPTPVWSTSSTLAGVLTNSSFSYNLVATDVYNNMTYSLAAGNTLPTNTTLSSSGVFSGNVASAGTYSFYVTATNTIGNSATQIFNLTVSIYTVQYLVVAGGGGGGTAPSGGGSSGGGGSGSATVGSFVAVRGLAYTIATGLGGIGGAPSAVGPVLGSNGFQSNIKSTTAPGFSTITATGGGGGSNGNPQQGITPSYPYGGIGGVGAGGGGGNYYQGPPNPSATGNGGPGYTWPYTNTAYGGGGGAGGDTLFTNISPTGTGGPGGGGPGGPPGSNGSSATFYGGGGGGGGYTTPAGPYGNGGAGYPGIVILAIPTVAYPASSPGSGGVTTPASAPGYTVLTYTGPGTFTA